MLKNNITVFFGIFLVSLLFVPPSFGQAGYSGTLYYYVDPLPDWASYAEGTVQKVFPYWENKHPGLKFVEVNTWEESDFAISWVKDFGGMHLGYAYGSEFIEIGLGDSGCGGTWFSFDQSSIIDTITHEVGHIIGYDHNNNPNDIMYANARFNQYDKEYYEFDTAAGYVHWYPICSTRQLSTYDYEISINDSNGFDFYFVPSGKEFDKNVSGSTWSYYDQRGCYAENVVRHTGTCSGIDYAGGIIIITPDRTDQTLVTISLSLSEKSAANNEGHTSDTSPTLQPDVDDTSLVFKLDSLKTNKKNYEFGETIEIRGSISSATMSTSSGMKIHFSVTDPLGEYVSVTQTFIKRTGEFYTIIIIPEHKKKGEYTLTAYNNFDFQYMGEAKFTIGGAVTTATELFTPETIVNEPYVPVTVEDLSRYENQEYGFTVKYPKDWLIDDSLYEFGAYCDVDVCYDWGTSYVAFCGEGYFANDGLCWDWLHFVDIKFYENDSNTKKTPGQPYLENFVKVMREDCPKYTVEVDGYTCSNYVTVSSKILQVDGKQAYQVVEGWTETWPDTDPYRNIRIYTEIPVGSDTWAIDITSAANEYPRMANTIDQMIHSFDIIESGESIPSSVNDRVPPLILVPSDIEVEQDDQYGAVVEYSVKAIDDIDGVIKVSCSPSTSSYFKIGTTTVNCHAKDLAGNDAQKSFNITVTGEAPSITPPTVVIPDWIKTTAGWWCHNEIEDSSFIEALQYLIKNNVIVVSATSGTGSTDEVPDWIKNNACWWSEGQIDDNTFANGIKYLIENGIVIV